MYDEHVILHFHKLFILFCFFWLVHLYLMQCSERPGSVVAMCFFLCLWRFVHSYLGFCSAAETHLYSFISVLLSVWLVEMSWMQLRAMMFPFKSLHSCHSSLCYVSICPNFIIYMGNIIAVSYTVYTCMYTQELLQSSKKWIEGETDADVPWIFVGNAFRVIIH